MEKIKESKWVKWGIALVCVLMLSVLYFQLASADELTNNMESENVNTEINQNEVVTLTQKGVLVKPNGDALSNALVKVQFGTGVSVNSYTDSNGSFTCTHENEIAGGQVIPYIGFQASCSDESGEYFLNKMMNNPPMSATYTTHDYGTLTCWYTTGAHFTINGVETLDNIYGKWSGYWPKEEQDFDFDNYTYNLSNKIGTYLISDENLTFDKIMFRSDDGWESKALLKINVKDGYKLEKIVVTDSTGQTCGESGSLTKPSYTFNAVIVPVTAKHTVTFDAGISKVLNNGTPITSGSEVADGSALTIVPVSQTDKITKVYVNNKLNMTNSTIVNSDVNIEGKLKDSIVLSGFVSNKTIVKNILLLTTSNDVNDAMISNARVTFTDNEGWFTSVNTASDGSYSLKIQKGLGGTLTVTSEGYESYSKSFKDSDLGKDTNADVVMTKTQQEDPINNNDTVASGSSSSTSTGDSYAIFAIIGCLLLGGSVVVFARRRNN